VCTSPPAFTADIGQASPIIIGYNKEYEGYRRQCQGLHNKGAQGNTNPPGNGTGAWCHFSILDSLDADWSSVLDLFSGSGSLGIEALSRGAAHVDFVDQERRCCDIIKENLVRARLDSYASVHCLNVSKAISVLNREYGIVLMDPPYKNREIGVIISQLADSEIVGKETPVFITHSALFASNRFMALLDLSGNTVMEIVLFPFIERSHSIDHSSLSR